MEVDSRFNAACRRLQQTLPARANNRLTGISFPTFDADLPVESAAVQLESAMEQLLLAMQNVDKQEQKRKVKFLVSKVFDASYPYVVRFLQFGKLLTTVLTLS